MPAGVVFVIVVPTANFEQEILNELPPSIASSLQKFGGTNNLNINLPDSNAVLRLEVELRDKNARRRPNYRNKALSGERNRGTAPIATGVRQSPQGNPNSSFIPMEKITQRLNLPSPSKADTSTTPTARDIRNSKMNADLNVLDQLVSTLLERHQQSPAASNNARESTKLASKMHRIV